MKTEFKLSDKKTENYLLLTSMPPKKTFCYREEDVKEFVRLLKEELELYDTDNKKIMEIINKFTGFEDG